MFRIEMQLTRGAWDQPVVVTHEDPRFAVRVAQALRREFHLPVRVTRPDPPPGAPAEWSNGEVIFCEG